MILVCVLDDETLCLQFLSYFILVMDIDECDANLCLNGATCVDGTQSFECQCDEGYYGIRCEASTLKSRASQIPMI